MVDIDWRAQVSFYRQDFTNEVFAMGSFVPAESAFSDSGNFVTSDTASLSDKNLARILKLRS
jgi:hypothetical protein